MSSDGPQIGFIGLGQMGGPMASSLVRAGYSVTVFDTRSEAMTPLVGLGAVAGESLTAVVAGSDVVFTSLPAPAIVETVFEDAVLVAGRPGLIVVDLSTNGPSLLRRLYERSARQGIRVVDCPVSGSHRGAVSGDLVMMAGGDQDAFDAVAPLLSTIGSMVYHTGGIGTGNVCKLAHNAISAVMGQALLESFVMAAKAGVEPRMIWEIVRRGTVGRMSSLHRSLPEGVLRGDMERGGKTYMHYQELALATDLARDVASPMLLASLSHERHIGMMNRGWANDSWLASELRLVEEAAGAEGIFRVDDLTDDDVGPPPDLRW
jgi:3-hydroxyisobutyrate dehydrogenase-like beta-hydroxyacid dehydrogenase